jgi:hypothetical protein
MILQNAYWYDIVPSHDDGSDAIEGKWLHFGPTEVLHSWVGHLDRLVESRQIYAAKVARKLPGIDPFPDKPCVLCAFTPASYDAKERVRQVLMKELGVSVSLWKSDQQTMEDWQPGGWLKLEAEVNRVRRRIQNEGLGPGGRDHLRQLVDSLFRALDEVKDPSRKAELEASRALALAHALADELKMPGASQESIVARLDDIQNQLAALVTKQSTPSPQAAALPAVTEDSNAVFVIMPFATKHVDTYDTIRRAVAGTSLGMRAERIDEVPGAIQITDEVRSAIRRARLVVCDLTDERPNVYYELGFAHGLSKQLICIARTGTKVHFDVYGLKTLFFESYRSLEDQLESEIRAIIARAESAAT